MVINPFVRKQESSGNFQEQNTNKKDDVIVVHPIGQNNIIVQLNSPNVDTAAY